MSTFLSALRAEAGRRRRLPIDRVWLAFRRADPVAAAAVDQRDGLRHAIDTLEAAGLVRTPRSAKRWDHGAAPALPAWIELMPDEAVSPSRDSTDASVAWAPELAFAAALRTPAHRDALLRVQHFLATGGRNRPLVPSRERSLELFGDEKRLDALAATQLFGPGRLDWALLRCHPHSPPMVWREHLSAMPSAIILENHHTWHSFERWNRERGVWRVVAYGAGKAVWTSAGSLAEALRARGIEHIEYFGDLDRTGIHIATRLAALAKEYGLPPVKPATRWYTLLLDRADAVPPIHDNTTMPCPDLSWFPSPLRERIDQLVRSGRRLPQELVGWEVLQSLPA